MPTSTIVQRIRNHIGDAGSWCILGNEAADEIERLQTALKNARDILGYSASVYIAGCSEDMEYDKRRSEMIAEIVAITELTE